MKDSEKFSNEDFNIQLYVDDRGINHDSAILLKSEGFSFFNQNDCKIFDRLSEIISDIENIDYYACQYSGANWFPSTYSMDNKEIVYKLVGEAEKLMDEAGELMDEKKNIMRLVTYEKQLADNPPAKEFENEENRIIRESENTAGNTIEDDQL